MSTASATKQIQWDKALVSETAAANWSWIHSDLGIPIGHLKPGVQGPCPKKGGKDKFRLYDDYHETGGAVSNEDGSFATGFHVIMWARDWNGSKRYSDTINLVGDHLHKCGMLAIPLKNGSGNNGRSVKGNTKSANLPATSSQGKGTSDSSTNGKALSPRSKAIKLQSDKFKVPQARRRHRLVPIDPTKELHRKAAETFARAKPGIQVETILNSGCEIGKWYDGTDILGMPAYLSSETNKPVHAEILYKASGELFAAHETKPERKVDLLMLKDSGDSLFTVGGTERLRLANIVVKVEGATCALAMAGIIPDEIAANIAVITNVCGARPKWTGPSAPDFSVFAEKRLITIGDNDTNGLGQRSARAFAETAVHHVDKSFLGAIPPEFKDVRDWIAAGNGWPEFEDLFAAAEIILPVETPVETPDEAPVETLDETAIQPGEGDSGSSEIEDPDDIAASGVETEPKESIVQVEPPRVNHKFIAGQRVQCGDLGNVGTVVSDDGGDTVKIHFKSKAGVHATKDIPREQVRNLDGLSDEPAQQIQIETFSAWDLIDADVKLDEEIIEGILRRGEVGNVIAATKVGKSWLGLCLACAVATGRRWLGRQTLKGNVLLIDNELRPATLRHRIATVLRAMGVKHDESHARLEVTSLRGQFVDIQSLEYALRKFKRDEFALLILDAKYRAFGPLDENSNTDQTLFHNAVDKIAGDLNSAFLMIHHSTKGDQGGKSTTDVGSGGGSQARAVDTHLIIRPHLDEGYAVLDAAVRSFAPVASQTLQWEFPLWHLAQSVEPILKAEKSRGDNRQESKDLHALGQLTDILHDADGAMTRYELLKQFGGGKDRVNRLIRQGLQAGRIVKVGTRNTRNGEQADTFRVASRVETSADTEAEMNGLF